MERFNYCPECLNRSGKLIRYAASQKYCAACESETLVPFIPAQYETPTVSCVLADRSTSSWLRNALSAALTRDPVDAANDAEVMASVLNSRCQQLLER